MEDRRGIERGSLGGVLGATVGFLWLFSFANITNDTKTLQAQTKEKRKKEKARLKSHLKAQQLLQQLQAVTSLIFHSFVPLFKSVCVCVH